MTDHRSNQDYRHKKSYDFFQSREARDTRTILELSGRSYNLSRLILNSFLIIIMKMGILLPSESTKRRSEGEENKPEHAGFGVK